VKLPNLGYYEPETVCTNCYPEASTSGGKLFQTATTLVVEAPVEYGAVQPLPVQPTPQIQPPTVVQQPQVQQPIVQQPVQVLVSAPLVQPIVQPPVVQSPMVEVSSPHHHHESTITMNTGFPGISMTVSETSHHHHESSSGHVDFKFQ
jgi:hypothetical protein